MAVADSVWIARPGKSAQGDKPQRYEPKGNRARDGFEEECQEEHAAQEKRQHWRRTLDSADLTEACHIEERRLNRQVQAG